MKRIIRYIILLIILCIGSFLLFQTVSGVRKKDVAKAKIQKLPALRVYQPDDEKVNIQDLAYQHPVVVIYFSPDCEHCQYEAAEIHQNLGAFKGTKILMITRANAGETRQFAQTYQLGHIPFIHFLLDKDNQFSKTFGTRVFPAIFIYNQAHELVKYFIGETKITAIVNALND